MPSGVNGEEGELLNPDDDEAWAAGHDKIGKGSGNMDWKSQYNLSQWV